jgi:hypothetical protein
MTMPLTMTGPTLVVDHTRDRHCHVTTEVLGA